MSVRQHSEFGAPHRLFMRLIDRHDGPSLSRPEWELPVARRLLTMGGIVGNGQNGSTNGAGTRRQRAAQMRAEAEARRAQARPVAPPAQSPAGAVKAQDFNLAKPVGQGDYVVRAGDCISSIARAHGFFWKTIWDAPRNAALREARGDPNVLLPGDRVTIPDKDDKHESCAAEQRHRFIRLGEPARFRIQILVERKPVACAPYTLVVFGPKSGKEVRAGQTDSEGRINEFMPGDATRGLLTVETDTHTLEYHLDFGHLPPFNSVLGMQRRLRNLAYRCELDGALGPRTKIAIARFQAACGDLEATGDPDPETQARLKEVHGS
jgi:hypothetical protein